MKNRVYHPWWSWECYKAGFFSTKTPEGLDKDQAQEKYRDFLSSLPRFEAGIDRVMLEWPNSCEHNLTNPSINRIAWLGQSAMCIETGVPAVFRGGFKLLSEEQQRAADGVAERRLNEWLEKRS